VTLPSENHRTQISADGTVGPFTYDFRIFVETDLDVIVADANGSNEVTKAIITDYNVDTITPTGGTITFVSGQEPANGELITMVSDVPFTQTLDLVENDASGAENIEERFDNNVRMSQQLLNNTDRAIKLIESAQNLNIAWPNMDDTENHGKALVIKDATTLTTASLTTGEVVPTAGSPIGDFSGDMTIVSTAESHITAQSSKLFMRKASSITTDKGRFVKPRQDLVCDVGATGAGGRDSGALASQWYELFYIFKGGVDNPDNPTQDALLAHKLPKPAIVEVSQTADNIDEPLFSAGTNERLGQSFKLTTQTRLRAITAEIKRVGTPAVGTSIFFTIEADVSGAPSGTALGTSEQRDANDIVTINERESVFRFETEVTSLTVGTTFWMVAHATYGVSASNHLVWRASNANPYADGTLSRFNGTTWTAVSGTDQAFRLITAEDPTALVMPSGFNEKALISKFFVSGSAVASYVQQDRMAYLRRSDQVVLIAFSVVSIVTFAVEPLPPGSNMYWFYHGAGVVHAKMSYANHLPNIVALDTDNENQLLMSASTVSSDGASHQVTTGPHMIFDGLVRILTDANSHQVSLAAYWVL